MVMELKRLNIWLLFFAIFLTSCSQAGEGKVQTTLNVAAAVSLQDALMELKEIYEKESDVEVLFQLGGSGTLARQLEQGMDADVFLSSNITWMDNLEEKDLIIKETRKDILQNRLVLVTNKDDVPSIDNLIYFNWEDVNRIAIGNPESVPAGEYAKEALMELEIWDEWENQFVFAKDVRQVMAYVESENADYGLVYGSDIVVSEQLHVVATIDSSLHKQIIYPGAVIKNSEHVEEATGFLQFLQTDVAQEVFKHYGFGGNP